MRQFVPADRLDALGRLFASKVEESLYVDALFVDPDYRGCGIGAKLLSLTEEKAVENNFMTLSLIVFADNARALPVYYSFGFVKVEDIAVACHELIPHEGGAYLMCCLLD